MRSRRRGFTLIEVVVAILLLALALTAMEAVNAATARLLADTGRGEHGVTIAAAQSARAVAACGVGSGSDSTDGTVVRWSGVLRPNGIRVLRVVSRTTRLGVQQDTFSAVRWCR